MDTNQNDNVADSDMFPIKMNVLLDRNNIVALDRCKVKDCTHLPYKLIQNSYNYIIDDKYDLIQGSKSELRRIMRQPSNACEYQYSLTLLEVYFKKCQKCSLTFQAYDITTMKSLRCPGCLVILCTTCHQNLSLYGQTKLVHCLHCQLDYYSCKNRIIRGLRIIQSGIEYIYWFFVYLMIFTLYTAFMLCFLPFYVLVKVTKKSCKKLSLPHNKNIILKILIYPFYLLFMLCFVLLYYVIWLIPLMLKYYVKFPNRFFTSDD